MFEKRIKIFIIITAAVLLACLLRLVHMQLLSRSFYRQRIAELKLQKASYRQFKTIRGKILDRKGGVLATDEPKFHLHINYRLTSLLDERVRRAKLLKAAAQKNADTELPKLQKEFDNALEDLQRLIDKCVHFGPERTDIENKIRKINDRIWNLRTFLAWRRNGPNPDILKKYNNNVISVPAKVAIEDFKKKFPDEQERLLLTARVNDIADMNKTWPLLELKTDDDIFTAQLEFLDINGIRILAEGKRFYPYGSAAAQTIGWVGPPQETDKQLFENDKLSSYLGGEVSGRDDGVEFVCETILRGRRGQEVFDIDDKLLNRTETIFGNDVSLTLDIELQKRIEQYLTDCEYNPNCKAPTAAAVIDVVTGDILALASTPVFDLNRIRYDYDALRNDPNEPLRNRAINKQYPPGSAVKPLILIAALESEKITADEVIGCPPQAAPKHWPSCWVYNRFGSGHDYNWRNTARNAIKGSCNIYFSHLANRIDTSILQQWLFKLGYGRKIPLAPTFKASGNELRELRQAQGQISNTIPKKTISNLDQLPPLKGSERRWFGIGQGNLRVTPLQVANAMAAIARDGLFKKPCLFTGDTDDSIALNISPATLNVVRDGMSAVVNETGGTAYNEFVADSLTVKGLKVYGKTGSTEKPANAWFAGFAEDRTDRSIAIAVVVEGGEHGSSDAAPLARDIFQFCIDAQYLGETN
jgi:penicillin-binding protein 2